MKRKIYIFFPIILLAILLPGCQKKSQEMAENKKSASTGTVNLVVWGAEEDKELLSQIISGFKAEYSGQTFNITYKEKPPQNKNFLSSLFFFEESLYKYLFKNLVPKNISNTTAIKPKIYIKLLFQEIFVLQKRQVLEHQLINMIQDQQVRKVI